MQPSDSLADDLPLGAGAFLPIISATDACAYQRASFGDESPALRPAGTPEERQGPPGLLGRPLRTCRGVTPRRTRPLLAPTSLREDLRRDRHRLHGKQNARHPERILFSKPTTHGPHARVPTLRRSRYRDRRQARYRLGRAHPWPGGFRTRWTTNRISWSHHICSNPNRPAEPGRTVSPSSFDVSSLSSEVARNKPSSSLHYGSSSRCTPRIARVIGNHPWIAPSGSLFLGGGHTGRTIS